MSETISVISERICYMSGKMRDSFVGLYRQNDS